MTVKEDSNTTEVSNQNNVKNRNENSENINIVCSESAAKFKKEDSHKRKNESSEKPLCPHCHVSFKRRCDMLRHVRKIHTKPHNYPTKRRRRTEIEYKVFCDVCKLGYTRKHDMEKHRKIKHPDAKPIEMQATQNITDNNECNEHLQDNCKTKQIHLRRRKSEIIAKHYCDVCNKGFTRKFDMEKHRSIKHPDAPFVERKINGNKENSDLLKKCKITGSDNQIYYKCEICAKLFRQTCNFLRHQSVHTGIRSYFCHICGKGFRVLGGLQRHINEHHYGIKKYACEVCGQKFAAKTTRDDHLNTHSNTRPFVCDVCGKAFKQKASLHIHKLFHTNIYRFSCSVCGKKFRRASELKVHGYLHTGHKPHKCEVCGAMFRLKQDLKRHNKVHVQCYCAHCGRNFSQEKQLKNHIRECQRKCEGEKNDIL